MTNEVQQIFCDESGSTGNNLMDPGQPFFSYASIAISHDEALDCVSKMVTDFRINKGELKAKNLLSNHRGRKAITRLLEQYRDRILISIFDKKYSLACKLFEYAFEPTVASHNSIFYTAGFHEFIANSLYLYFKAGNSLAEAIFDDFQGTMRSLDGQASKYLFGAVRLPEAEVILDLVRRFCFSNRQAIQRELDSLQNCSVGQWVLDLADTALYGHLGEWGNKYSQLDVYCDTSQALIHIADTMTTMIGREDKVYSSFGDKKQSITFNLSQKISLVKSSEYPGVQLADLVAGASIFAMRNKDDNEVQKWRTYLPGMLHLRASPDPRHLDMRAIPVQRNLLLLRELVRRSEAGISLTEDIGAFLAQSEYILTAKGPTPSVITPGRGGMVSLY
jgi:hypothetical protein